MKNRLRLLVYSALALPLLAAGLLVASLNPNERNAVIGDFKRNTVRLLAGELHFSDLVETPRAGNGDIAIRRRRRGEFEAAALFARMDTSGDGKLEGEELGERMRQSLERIDLNGDQAMTLDELQQGMQMAWFTRPEERHVGPDPAFVRSADLPADSLAGAETSGTRLHASTLFDPERVIQIEIQLPDRDWRSLCNQTRDSRSAMENPLDKPYTYFQGDITIDGVVIRQVGIRKKGFIGSQDTIRPSLKIHFDKYVPQQPIDGLDRLTLNNNRQDTALVSQFLTYRLFHKAQVAAPRCSYAAVTVNGQYLGVYSHVESVRKPFLNASFGNDSGKLYEGTLADFYPKSIEWMEAKLKPKHDDRAEAMQLAERLDSDDGPSLAQIAELVDVDRFLRYWATESLINFWDGYTQNQNNYFAYANPEDGKFHFIPWGADSCFGGRPGFSRWGTTDSNVVRAVSILANRLYHVQGVPEMYRDALVEILASVWDEQELLDETDRIEKLLFDHVDFRQVNSILAMERVREFVRRRRDEVLTELESRSPIEVASEPRTPMHRVEIGSVKGTFSTIWEDGERGLGEDVSESHQPSPAKPATTVTMDLDGEKIELGTATANLWEPWVPSERDADSTPSRSHPLGSLTFRGQRAEGPLALELTLVDAMLAAGLGKPIPISGLLTDDETGDRFPERGQSIVGEITFTELGTALGEHIRGEFELKFRETRGGFMNRRRW